jgi:ATP-dependent DNA helicase RecQ
VFSEPNEPLAVLKQFFGYDSFRYGQEALIGDILGGRDVLGIMPTGAGKSICFQVPALMMDGVIIVVSPLISLMKDQVNALNQTGVAAAFINSSLTQNQIDKALRNAANGAYRLVYVAPERLLSFDFLGFAADANIPMVVVDEAHCISQWGQDFRPSYATIPNFVAQLRKRPILAAFTATATPRVREDIVDKLALKDPNVLVSGFDRPNLRFDKIKIGDKYGALLRFLKGKSDVSGIVYCSTRNAVEEVQMYLEDDGYSAARYHAGLSDTERHKNQDDFLYDRKRIMVATNAFGMGIDKSNVSFVVHYNMPGDVEAYYQEAGRAGRDGAPADCLLLHTGRDYSTQMWLINNGESKKQLDRAEEAALRERNIKRLNEMQLYCDTKGCMRAYILGYFGENPPTTCNNCANCAAGFEEIDITIEAKKIISCVVRMRGRFGTQLVIDVLKGLKNRKVLEFRLDELTTFGISNMGREFLSDVINHLISEGYLHKTATKFPLLNVTPKGLEFVRGASLMAMQVAGKVEAVEPVRRTAQPLQNVNPALLDALKTVRLNLARETALPAFVIFHDTTLIDMCMKMPADMEQLLEVSGVGQVKAERYGQAFLDAINNFSGERTSFAPRDFDPANIQLSEESITVNAVAGLINAELLQCGYDKISGKRINEWLIASGLLQNSDEGKIPTQAGEALGIYSEMRDFKGVEGRLNFFPQEAQSFIARNSLEILTRHEVPAEAG